MKHLSRWIMALAALVTLTGALRPAALYDWHLPAWMPPPPPTPDNPMSTAKVELGRYLFYDARLSADDTIACASCHLQSHGFADARAKGVGVGGEVGTRNVPGLANVAYFPVLTWGNPLLKHLEHQALIPIFGISPPEMAMEGREEAMIARLSADPAYLPLFGRAFPDSRGEVTLKRITQAIAAFERSLISYNAPYDRYKYGGQTSAISDAAKRGEALFFSHDLECYHCHTGPNFTGNFASARSRQPEVGYHNNGLYDLDGKGAYPFDAVGIKEHTGRAEDMGRFRTPSLRNVAVTAPYMHDGSLPTLRDVIRHYAAGGHVTMVDGHRSDGRNSPLKDPLLGGFDITPDQEDDLVAFLESLTDRQFLTNSHFSDPWPAAHPARKNRRNEAK